MRPGALASWPASATHSYLRLFYDAISRRGVRLAFDGAPVEDAFLRAHATEIGAFHFHWPEHIWGSCREGSVRHRGRTLLGLWRFLRLARKLRILVIWTVHNIDRHDAPDWLDRVGMRLFNRYASVVISHTEWTKETLARRLHTNPADVVVMRIGSDVRALPRENSEPVRGKDASSGPHTLLCFGLIRSYKGFDIAIRAAALLGPDYRLIVAGQALQESVAQQMREMAVSLDNVQLLLTHVSDQAVTDLIAAADAVLLPYREVTGSAVLLSALSGRRGVVASDLPFFREMLAPEPEAGELCPPDDPAALAAAIRRFFALPLVRRRAAAGRLAERYAWDRVVEPVVAKLQQLHLCDTVSE
jgi:glycosyltransferase involved in cell wall biosynthesis